MSVNTPVRIAEYGCPVCLTVYANDGWQGSITPACVHPDSKVGPGYRAVLEPIMLDGKLWKVGKLAAF